MPEVLRSGADVQDVQELLHLQPFRQALFKVLLSESSVGIHNRNHLSESSVFTRGMWGKIERMTGIALT